MTLRIQLLLTGSELMSGDIVDSNSAMIARHCYDLGFSISRKVTVGDQLQDLVREIRLMTENSDVVIINGGLGPTVDDLTAEALALAADVPLQEHPGAMTHLRQWCRQRNYPLNQPNLKQAILPADVELIPNPVGSAVGFALHLNGCQVYCTPGVPSELRHMLTETIDLQLALRQQSGQGPEIRRMWVFGLGESQLQKMIDESGEWPAEIELGFRASMPMVEVKLRMLSSEFRPHMEQCEARLESLLGAHIVCRDGRSLEQVVVDALQQRSMKMTTAESCTGGRVAAAITSVAGASAVYEAGVVSYSNRIKSSLLQVSQDSLHEQGAVSRPVVEQMLEGALQLSGADVGVAISGIAGPDGGSDEKPVGTVWLAWGGAGKIRSSELYWPGQRQTFQQIITAVALDCLRREVLDIEEPPLYLSQRQRPGN